MLTVFSFKTEDLPPGTKEEATIFVIPFLQTPQAVLKDIKSN